MTDKAIEHLCESLPWGKMGGLIPAIAQDYSSKEVLMQAYMDKEAFKTTLQTRIAHYFSRSKNRLWKKGEESGHIQEVYSISLDCDKDCILLIVKQHGVACHTGNRTCFFDRVATYKDTSGLEAFSTLYQTLLERKRNNDRENSYTAQLLSKGENTVAKKIVEESAELGFAIKDNKQEEIVYEMADLVYHSFVGLVLRDISLDLVCAEIARRFGTSGIVEKRSREQEG